MTPPKTQTHPAPANTAGAFTLTSAELFAGAGGLSVAVDAAFNATNLWFAEIDKAPSKVLAHRFPNTPNYGDVTKIDWTKVPLAKVLSLGFPCNDVSLAGRMKGMNGTRSGLWSEGAKAIEQMEPDWVVIENVRGLLSTAAQTGIAPMVCGWCDGDTTPLRAMGAVLLDLARLGYDAEWVGLRAADIGAPHGRFRVFIVAWKKTLTTPTMMPAPFAQASQERRNWETANVNMMCGHADLYPDAWPTSGALRDGTVYERDAYTSGQYDKLLPTPNTMEHLPAREGEARERALHRGDLNGSRRTESANLRERIIDDLPLLRTPAAAEAEGGPRNRDRPNATMRLSDQVREEMDDGNIVLFPTPSVANADGGQTSRSGDRKDELLLGGIAVAVSEGLLLPTPEAKLGSSGPDYARMQREGSGGDDLATTIARNMNDGTHWGPYEAAIRRAEHVFGRRAPAPVKYDGKDGKPRLSSDLTEFMMGWPEQWVTDPAIGLTRNEQLRICGNGVVPQQALFAIRICLTRPGVPPLHPPQLAA